jgi:hypothetical protein
LREKEIEIKNVINKKIEKNKLKEKRNKKILLQR